MVNSLSQSGGRILRLCSSLETGPILYLLVQEGDCVSTDLNREETFVSCWCGH